MLKLTIDAIDLWDENKEEFVTSKAQNLTLEHSLVSLSKWESKWKKPFLSDMPKKTTEETLDYIKCMTITQNVPDDVYDYISTENIKKVNSYIEDSMTATTFCNYKKNPFRKEVITAEIIYYWMVAMSIPFECQKWHLNRLLTFIHVCSIKNQPKSKMSRHEILGQNKARNAARRKAHHTKG